MERISIVNLNYMFRENHHITVGWHWAVMLTLLMLTVVLESAARLLFTLPLSHSLRCGDRRCTTTLYILSVRWVYTITLSQYQQFRNYLLLQQSVEELKTNVPTFFLSFLRYFLGWMGVKVVSFLYLSEWNHRWPLDQPLLLSTSGLTNE